jgi:hypothetical protein
LSDRSVFVFVWPPLYTVRTPAELELQGGTAGVDASPAASKPDIVDAEPGMARYSV